VAEDEKLKSRARKISDMLSKQTAVM
jgi:hypothetical protein